MLFNTAKAEALSQSDLPGCAASKSDFSGIPTLTYATVLARDGEKDGKSARLYFHPEHPSRCPAPDMGACKGTAYLVPGDAVAIGASCNGWDYVQYLGQKSVTVGWVEDALLGSRETPTEIQPAKKRKTRSISSVYRFVMKKGQGVPVCEAYLQRLNQTAYEDHPYCGLPENDQVPGFARLNRAYLPTERVNDLYAAVEGFLRDAPSSRYYMKQLDGQMVPPSAEHPFLPPESKRSTWSYDPPIDIDNDGTPDDGFVIWNTDDRDRSSCGSFYGPTALTARQFSQAVLLTADGGVVDKEKTTKVFSHPGHAPWLSPDRNTFWPIGYSYGVFEYRRSSYFETFFDNSGYIADFYNRRRNDSKLQNTLGVFMHKNGVTRQMCEYYVRQ
jgi:hypothetical protein